MKFGYLGLSILAIILSILAICFSLPRIELSFDYLGLITGIYSRIDMKDLEESIEWIGYAVNDMDNTISEIDYNDPMTFFDIEKSMSKAISKELKCNSLK